MATATTGPGRDTAAEVAFLTRALKAPTLRDAVDRLAGRARDEGWSHEEFLIACLQREVSARESHGGEGRILCRREPPHNEDQLPRSDCDGPGCGVVVVIDFPSDALVRMRVQKLSRHSEGRLDTCPQALPGGIDPWMGCP